MPTDRQLVGLTMGQRPYAPGYGYQPGGRLTDLIMHQGQIQADAARASGENWANALTSVGETIAGGLQQRDQERKKRARDAAWADYVGRGEWSADPRSAYAKALEVWGPEEGPKQFQGLVAVSQLTQPRRNPEADQKALGAVGAAMSSMDDTARATLWPQARTLTRSVLPDVQLPEQYDPQVWKDVVEPFVRQMNPPRQRSTTVVDRALVDNQTGEKLYEAPPEPQRPVVVGRDLVDPASREVIHRAPPDPRQPREPRLERIETVGPDGRTVQQFVEPRPGVSYPTPAKAPPQQRLTRDERQDFAAWNYALPKLEAFTQYVEANPGQYGTLDAMVQGMKQRIPGLADSDYASNRAFINRINSEIRHALYGASLTGGEQQSAEGFIVSESDQPAVIIAKVTEAMSRAQANRDYYQQMGFTIPGATPQGGGAGAAAGPPVTGARRRINGQLAEWDGHGWLAVQ